MEYITMKPNGLLCAIVGCGSIDLIWTASVSLYISMDAHAQTHTHTHTRTHTQYYILLNTHTHTQAHTFTHTSIYTCIYIYRDTTHTHTHTHTHAHISGHVLSIFFLGPRSVSSCNARRTLCFKRKHESNAHAFCSNSHYSLCLTKILRPASLSPP